MALVADRLLIQISKELARPIQGLSVGAIARLRTHSWPGNVRELRNVLTRAVVKARGRVLTEDDLELGAIVAELAVETTPATPGASAGVEPTRPRAPIPTLEDAERELVRRALDTRKDTAATPAPCSGSRARRCCARCALQARGRKTRGRRQLASGLAGPVGRRSTRRAPRSTRSGCGRQPWLRRAPDRRGRRSFRASGARALARRQDRESR